MAYVTWAPPPLGREPCDGEGEEDCPAYPAEHQE